MVGQGRSRRWLAVAMDEERKKSLSQEMRKKLEYEKLQENEEIKIRKSKV